MRHPVVLNEYNQYVRLMEELREGTNRKFERWHFQTVEHFKGSENDIVVYFIPDTDLDFEALSRARRLLILFTSGICWEKKWHNIDPSNRIWSLFTKFTFESDEDPNWSDAEFYAENFGESTDENSRRESSDENSIGESAEGNSNGESAAKKMNALLDL